MDWHDVFWRGREWATAKSVLGNIGTSMGAQIRAWDVSRAGRPMASVGREVGRHEIAKD